ncbi:MAG: hypothetical protein O7A09_07195, partial [Proteobacteria bacterium]|nr:hypothetical protein [Pseudomonadota bacterium]
VDREENGGVRGVPSYFLNGNVGVARAYSGRASAIDAEGSVRADTTGTYGAAGIHDLEHAQNQLAPTLIVQVQGHVGDRFRAIALGGLAVGAKMIGVWRDWPPSAPTHGRVRVAPELQLCGAVDFGLRTRRRYQNPSGQIVTGAESGARAEILDGPKPYDECPGNGGAAYRVHVRRGRFEPGEALRDAESGAPIAGATVAGTRGEGLVDYEVTIARRRWYEEMPKLRREVDALAPILRASHWTDWQARARATARGLGPVLFGDEGIVWGTRTHDGEAYLFLANTFHQLDPHRDWDAQWLGRPLDVEVRLESLPGRALRARRFDVEALSFTDTGSVPIEGGRFVLTLPTFGVEVLHLVRERE